MSEAATMWARDAWMAWTPKVWAWKVINPDVVGQLIIGRDDGRRSFSDAHALDISVGGRDGTGLQPSPVTVIEVFSNFSSVVVRDGINPKSAHKEFLKVREYAYHVTLDNGGVIGPDDYHEAIAKSARQRK